MENKKNNNKKIAFPDAYIIIFTLSLIAAISTYIIPSGSYEREEQGDITTVIPGSYSSTEASPTGVMDFFTAIPNGLIETADIVFLVLVIGGVIAILDSTGATYSGINALVEKTKHRKYLLVITVLTVFAIISSVGVSGNAVIAFIPIGIMLAKAFKLDAIAGVAMVYLGSYAGGAVAAIDPAIMGVAQTVAGLPLFSGAWLRIIATIPLLAVTAIYVCLYIRKISNDPSKSIIKDNPFPTEEESNVQIGPFTKKHQLIIAVFLIFIGIFLYGVFNFDWAVTELTAIFLMMGITVAIIARISPNEFVKEFMNGVKKLAYGALIVGIARSIIVILNDGNILDTIVNAVVPPLQNLPTMLGAEALFVFNLFFNIIISSGSGQASVVMPLMVPIGDILGITRQTGVLVFKLGDGITNIITPASGVLMAVLAVGGVSWVKWVKFVYPLVLLWSFIGAIFVGIAILINYGPF